jgi:hypothetical protein
MVLQINGYGVRVTVMVLESNGYGAATLRAGLHPEGSGGRVVGWGGGSLVEGKLDSKGRW